MITFSYGEYLSDLKDTTLYVVEGKYAVITAYCDEDHKILLRDPDLEWQDLPETEEERLKLFRSIFKDCQIPPWDMNVHIYAKHKFASL